MGIEQVLPFGDRSITVELPKHTRVVKGGGLETKLEPVEDLRRTVREALENPLGLPPLPDLVRPGSRVAIAFDDPTVPTFGTMRGTVIGMVLEVLEKAGVNADNVHLVCANALHRKWTREELSAILGEHLVKEFGPRLTCHDAEDAANLVHLGTTQNGYDVEVHRLVADSDLTIYVNAGTRAAFNGGWKSICVGLSTYRSIKWTHTPDGMSMSVRDNRMHRVFDEMGAYLEERLGKRIFKIETIMANPFEVGRLWAGGVAETRAAAMPVIESLFPPRREMVEERADVILYGLPNWSPYATFSHMNPLLTLVSTGLGYLGGVIEAMGKPGCTVVMATPCENRWNMVHHPAYPEVWDRVLSQTTDAYEIHRRFEPQFATRADYIEKYRFGYAFHPTHAIMATHPLKRLRHASRVIVAGAEEPALVKHIGFIPAASVEEALAQAQKIHGRECSIVCVDYGVGK